MCYLPVMAGQCCRAEDCPPGLHAVIVESTTKITHTGLPDH